MYLMILMQSKYFLSNFVSTVICAICAVLCLSGPLELYMEEWVKIEKVLQKKDIKQLFLFQLRFKEILNSKYLWNDGWIVELLNLLNFCSLLNSQKSDYPMEKTILKL